MKKNFGLGLATLALSIAHASTAQAALITGVTATTDMGSSITRMLIVLAIVSIISG